MYWSAVCSASAGIFAIILTSAVRSEAVMIAFS